jgi:hypothetical protein
VIGHKVVVFVETENWFEFESAMTPGTESGNSGTASGVVVVQRNSDALIVA